MSNKINEEDLEKVSGGYKRFPMHAENDVVCPYCGAINHAVFDAKGIRFSPGQSYLGCGPCVNYFEGNCKGIIKYDLNTCEFYFDKVDD